MPITVPSAEDLQALAARVDALEAAQGGGGGEENPPEDPTIPEHRLPFPNSDAHPYFRELAPRAHRWWSGRQQAEIDAFSMGNAKRLAEDWLPNQAILYDPDIDGARMWTQAGEKGVPLLNELKLPLRFDAPTGGDTWAVSVEVWLSRDLEQAFRTEIGNGGTKFLHMRGAHLDKGDYKDGIFKHHLNFKVGEAGPQPPYFGVGSMQTSAEMVFNVSSDPQLVATTRVEPWLPADWRSQPMQTGTWHQLVFYFTEEAGLVDGKQTAVFWATQDGYVMMDPRRVVMPWNYAVGRGIHYLHVLVSYKEVMPWAVSMGVRNLLVLKNPSLEDLGILSRGRTWLS